MSLGGLGSLGFLDLALPPVKLKSSWVSRNSLASSEAQVFFWGTRSSMSSAKLLGLFSQLL